MDKSILKRNAKECVFDVFFSGNEYDFESLVEVIRFVHNETGYLGEYVVYENDEDFFNRNYNGNVFDLVKELMRFNHQYDMYSDYVKLDDYGNLISYDVCDLKEIYTDYFDEIFEHIVNCPECYYLLDDYVVELIKEYNSIN